MKKEEGGGGERGENGGAKGGGPPTKLSGQKVENSLYLWVLFKIIWWAKKKK